MTYDQFIKIRDDFQNTRLYLDMLNTVEDSPWHREESVAIHTDMVVDEYLKNTEMYDSQYFWLGALACLFHDVGKPIAEETKHSDIIGTYRSYANHELASARVFENYALTHLDLSPEDILRVGWIIQNHLPYKIKDKRKRQALVDTAFNLGISHIFPLVLMADQNGRISDNHEKNRQEVVKWIDEFNNTTPEVQVVGEGAPRAYILVGPSGAGKSTFTKEMLELHPDTVIYSWDQLRLDWYGEPGDDPADVYGKAFEKSCEDKEFNQKVQREFMNIIKAGKDVIIDNTNLSSKRRKFFAQEAMKKGYLVTSVVFMIKRDTLLQRLDQRNDRDMNPAIVINMHENMTYPNIPTECHNVIPRVSG